jgi:hypothetical protein
MTSGLPRQEDNFRARRDFAFVPSSDSPAKRISIRSSRWRWRAPGRHLDEFIRSGQALASFQCVGGIVWHLSILRALAAGRRLVCLDEGLAGCPTMDLEGQATLAQIHHAIEEIIQVSTSFCAVSLTAMCAEARGAATTNEMRRRLASRPRTPRQGSLTFDPCTTAPEDQLANIWKLHTARALSAARSNSPNRIALLRFTRVVCHPHVHR